MELTYADYVHTPWGTRQRDLTPRVTYDRAYLDARYAGIPEKVAALADRRVRVLSAFVPTRGRLLDFGCGLGAVVTAARRAGWDARGHDLVEPPPDVPSVPKDELAAYRWDVACFFDSLEHLIAPDEVIRRLDAKWVYISVPWCHFPDRPEWFMPWRHRRPFEHLHFWGADSLDRFFALAGYRPVLHSSFEDEFRANPDQREPNILAAVYRRA